MNAAAEKIAIELPAVRRFELADLTEHGGWLLPRLVKQYPHLTLQTAMGFLRNILYSPEYHFCYGPHAAGLVQIERAYGLSAKPIVREKFVWVQEPKNAAHLAEAVQFYEDFQTWAKHHGAEVMIVEEASDVPHDMIRERFSKRIFSREQQFVRI